MSFMKQGFIAFSIAALALLSACVSQNKYNQLDQAYTQLQQAYQGDEVEIRQLQG